MATSPHEKLRALEDVLRKKEAEKQIADKQAKKAEEELRLLRRALRAEQDEILQDEFAVRNNQSENKPQEELVDEQEEVARPKRNREETIDELIRDVPPNQQLGGALYALQERMKGGMNLYEMTQTAHVLSELRQESALTQNQYTILNQFEEQLREKGVQTGYSGAQQAYARQATNTIEALKQQTGVKIGNSYVNNDDFML